MTVFWLVLVLMLLGMAAMSVGVLFGRKPISGSCGGLANSGVAGGGPCEICGGNPAACDADNTQDTTRPDQASFYDASRG